MKVYMEKIVRWVFIILFAAVLYNFGYGETHEQPFMDNALRHLEKALNVTMGKAVQLNKAKTSLELGTSDKGGHRIAAINKINQALAALVTKDFAGTEKFTREAIDEVKAGIAYSDQTTNNPPPVIVNTQQPFMELGLKNLELALTAVAVGEKIIQLEKAKSNLNSALADKGGHRVAAILKIDMSLRKLNHNRLIEANALIREAIEQVKLGIAAGAVK